MRAREMSKSDIARLLEEADWANATVIERDENEGRFPRQRVLEMAETNRDIFEEHVRSGFSEEQAMQILLAMIS